MIYVGQKVVVKTIGNAVRYGTNILETIVTKVGTKYFYLEGFTREKFSLETMTEVTEYTPNYKVYLSKQKLEDEIEANILYDNIRKTFQSYTNNRLSLNQLKKINEIIRGD